MSLHVGDPVWSRPDQSTLTKAGVLTCGGISIFGDCSSIGGQASVTIGPADGDSLQKNKELSLFILGKSFQAGDQVQVGDYELTGDQKVEGSITASNEVTASGITLTSRKAFDILHPLKSGHRLRHLCLEGPESGVYYRGRLKGSNIIKLPDYWEQLVHADSITVQLQPIGDRHFHLNVVSFDNKEIIIKEADDKPIDCFYHVYGERKDGEKLIAEYKGISIDDYPGDNSIYSINK